MSIEFELFDQAKRRARRRGFFGGVILVLVVIAVLLVVSNLSDLKRGDPHIARVKVVGQINDDRDFQNLISRLKSNENVKALIVHINSPGGSVVGAESIYVSLSKLSQIKPSVSVLGETAASGGYLIALASDFIVSRGNTLTGSVGVIVQYPNFSELLEKLGVSINTLKSADLKASFNFFEEPTEKAIETHKALVNETFVWFKNLVATERNLSNENLNKVLTGELFTGRMALKIGMLDKIGGEEEAVKYLTNKYLELDNLPIVDWSIKKDNNSIWNFFEFVQDVSHMKARFLGDQGPRLYSTLF